MTPAQTHHFCLGWRFHLKSNSKTLFVFSLGLKNSASIYQDTIRHLVQSEQEIPLAGAQRGLVLSITPEGGIVHWLGA